MIQFFSNKEKKTFGQMLNQKKLKMIIDFCIYKIKKKKLNLTNLFLSVL